MSNPVRSLLLITSLLLLPSPAFAQSRNDLNELTGRLAETEFAAEVSAIELKLANLEVEEAEVEVEKVKIRLIHAEKTEGGNEVAHVKAERRQAELQVAMRKLHVELKQLQIVRARKEIQRLRGMMDQLQRSQRQHKPAQVEHIPDLGVVIIRGTNVDVEKIKALLNAEAKEKKE